VLLASSVLGCVEFLSLIVFTNVNVISLHWFLIFCTTRRHARVLVIIDAFV
jgi:hypothetical protein